MNKGSTDGLSWVCPARLDLRQPDRLVVLLQRVGSDNIVRMFRSPIVRRRRQWTAAVLLFVLAFAQAMTAAHACPILNPSLDSSGVASVADAMPTDCADMAKRAGSSANLCQSHCFAGQQVTAQADAPMALAAPLSPLTVRVTDPFVSVAAPLSVPSAIGAASPPLLRFGRLLI